MDEDSPGTSCYTGNFKWCQCGSLFVRGRESRGRPRKQVVTDVDQSALTQMTLFGGPPAITKVQPASAASKNILRKIREYHNRAERIIEAYYDRETCPRLSLGPEDPGRQ